MELFRDLVELNNQIELKKIAESIYTIESDDEEEEIEFIHSLRQKFISEYLKINNRQFKLIRNTLKKKDNNIEF
tara:strand:+ start:325 stop:546 length:222 start_codon:yes stop_codon:yes gene_type:complete